MGNLGKLNIVISAVNKTKTVFKSVTSGLNNIRKETAKALKIFAGLTTAVGGVGVALGLLIKRNTEAIDRIQKVSDKLGIQVELLQKLRFAADQTGIAQETLDMAMQRFIRRVGEAQKGTGEAQGALAELGIQLKNADGSFRSTESVLFDVADGLQNAKDSSTQLRLAFKFFDSEGAALVNTLKNGSSGLKEFFTQAEQLGILIDSKTAASAAKFTDETSKLTKQIDTIQKLFSMAFVPALTEATTQISNFFSKIAQQEGGVKKFTDDLAIGLVEGFARSLIAIDTFVSGFTSLFGGIGNIIKGAQVQFFKLASVFEQVSHSLTFGLSGSLEKAKEFGDKADELFASLAQPPATNTFLTTTLETLNNLRETMMTTTPVVVEGLNKGEDAVLSFQEKLAIFAGQVNEPLKALQMKFRTTGQMIGDTIASSMKKFEDTLVDGLMSGKFAFKDFANFVIKELVRIAVKKLIIDKITGGFTSFLGGLGKKERGGTVTANRPYLVGEAGAELFVPNKTGTIVPNNRLGGGMGSGSMPVNITYNIQAFDSKDTLAAITENAPTISAIIETEFNRRGRRGFVT